MLVAGILSFSLGSFWNILTGCGIIALTLTFWGFLVASRRFSIIESNFETVNSKLNTLTQTVTDNHQTVNSKLNTLTPTVTDNHQTVNSKLNTLTQTVTDNHQQLVTMIQSLRTPGTSDQQGGPSSAG